MEDRIKSLIEIHVSDFLETRLRTIQKISLDDFEINSFLISAAREQLGMKNQKDLARWIVNQRSERGLVTSFGRTLQNVAKAFTNEATTPGFTMTLKKNGKKYNILVTSGPNPYAKRQAVDVRKQFEDSIEANLKSVPVLGMCYGNDEVIGTIIKTELKGMKYYAGRKFWEFISGEKGCRDEILEIISETAANFQDLDNKSILSVINKKINDVEEELCDKYGKDEKKFWKNLFRDIYKK